VLAAASAVYLAGLASLTLGPQPEGVGGVLQTLADGFAGVPATAWMTYAVLEFTANVALFVPFGLLWILWCGPRQAWIGGVAGLAMSVLIEATQALALPDRYPDVRDLIANGVGALLGALILAAVARRHARGTRARDLTAHT